MIAPDRRQEMFDFLLCAGAWMASLVGALWAGLHLLVVAANASQPVRLSLVVWLLLGLFMLATLGWAYGFYRRFNRPA